MEQLSSEQLEEGEIVDDDDFEDISDNSITDSTFGKFVSSNEHLRAVSLSSDSDVEICKNVKRRKKLLLHKNRTRHQKKRKKHKIPSDSSDSDVSTCSDLKDKLKEAVHISGIVEGQKKPLETRLKGMCGVTSNTNGLAENTEPPIQTENENDSDKIDDHELEKLRIEALKTAVLNKFQRRKRKRTVLEEHKKELEPLKTLENKENNTPKTDKNPVSDDCNFDKGDAKNVNIDLEEDEDVLRASLLAGLAKKITKIQTTELKDQAKPDAPALPSRVAPMLPKLPVNTAFNKKVIQNRPKPQVKPLIINVNEDSDSEEDQKQKPKPLSKVSDLNVITSNVEKFLKEQRAKFETETKKRFQIVHKNKTKSILEKSAVKLLPKSQQIEYQQLLKKLKIAERRKRAKKIALQKIQNKELQKKNQCSQPTVTVEVLSTPAECPVSIEVPSNSVEVEICVNSSVKESDVTVNKVLEKCEEQVAAEPVVEAKSSSEIEDNLSKKENREKKKSGVTCELTILQKTLKDIKMQRNGSLQIKSKYQVLTPIIRKITATSNERKKQEQRIKHLLKDLNEARKSLAQSHEQFSALVKELVNTKGKIDSSCKESKKFDTKKQNNSLVDVRNNESEDNIHISFERDKVDVKKSGSVPITSTPKPEYLPLVEEGAVSTDITTSISNDYEDMDVCNSDETDMCQIDIVDPNDIDQIFTRKSVDRLSVPEYVSPLNLNTYERYSHVDPHGIMCPYEVNGSCRDIDCTFKHYLKKQC